MSILDQIEKPKDGTVVATILGDSGMGKTSLAATFPKPVFVRAEDGLQSIPHENRPDALPLVDSVDTLRAQLSALAKKDHQYETVVIDSVTALERMFVEHILENDKADTINQACGGFGAGFQALATMHQKVRQTAEIIRRRGIHVVFVAHADTEIVELPDQEPYTRYNLRLNKRSVAPYVDDSDLVGFIKLRLFTKKKESSDRAKAISDGTRVLVTYATAANVSKNRFGITEDLPVRLGENPLKPYIPSLNK